jgi:hypothetical protein
MYELRQTTHFQPFHFAYANTFLQNYQILRDNLANMMISIESNVMKWKQSLR